MLRVDLADLVLAAELGDAVHVDRMRLVLLGVEVALEAVENPAGADIDERRAVLRAQFGGGLRHDRVFDPGLFRVLFADLDIRQRGEVQHQIGFELVECFGHCGPVLAVEILQPVALVRLDLPVGRQQMRNALAEIRIDRIPEHAAAASDENPLVLHANSSHYPGIASLRSDGPTLREQSRERARPQRTPLSR